MSELKTFVSEEMLGRYTLDAYTAKLWEGNLVYHEELCPIEQGDGSVRSGLLLYTPKEILSVRSHDLKTVYEYGRDYIFEGRQLRLPEGSRIPVCPAEEYAPHYKEGEAEDVFVTSFDSTRHLVIDSELTPKYSVSVTYTHDDLWNGIRPSVQRDRLPRMAEKLANGEPLRVVFFGDSITVGWEATGLDDQVLIVENCEEYHAYRDWAPYCASWAKMVGDTLIARYGDRVFCRNRAASCSKTDWGLEQARNVVVPQNPDLVLIAFGMNEPETPRATMKQSLEAIMDAILEKCPQTEFVLVSCMLPNPDSKAFSGQILDEQEGAMWDIQKEGHYHVAVAPVNTMCRAVLDAGKWYPELSGNNFNHPNDLMHRIYAQTILSVLGE